jgi:ABC-type transporter Mla MlaB component
MRTQWMVGMMVLVIVLSSAYPAVCSPSDQTASGDDEVTLAVMRLRSANDAERASAKKKLIEQGAKSIPPLLVILKQLVDNQNRLYILPDESEEAEIASRLRPDVYELMGTLHSSEAIPLLIKAMEERPRRFLSEHCDLDMKALVDIGSAAVPQLVEAIQQAETTAERNEHRVYGGPHACLPIQVPALTIQIRAGKVLGDIGDVGALPILEELLKETKTVDFWYAIQQIKKKNGATYRRWPPEADPRSFCTSPPSE